MSAAKPGGFKLASRQGVTLKLKGSTRVRMNTAPAPGSCNAGCIHVSLYRLLVSGELMVILIPGCRPSSFHFQVENVIQ